MATELIGRMRGQPAEKIDRGQVRSRGEPFLDHGNVWVELRWPTWHRFAPHIAAPMNTPLLTVFPTIAELSGKGGQVALQKRDGHPWLSGALINALAQLILSVPHLGQQCHGIKRAVNLPQPTFECLIEMRVDQCSFVRSSGRKITLDHLGTFAVLLLQLKRGLEEIDVQPCRGKQAS
ncbi:hypothetical protein A1D31_38460 [Bradyrhizobium liaoningense]|nr:hypothetical protein A1D31_38460 [Bradyrhizobium liaoningense]